MNCRIACIVVYHPINLFQMTSTCSSNKSDRPWKRDAPVLIDDVQKNNVEKNTRLPWHGQSSHYRE